MLKTALIPAAGRGLRLDRPGTPKPLVDVDGQPMLFRLVRQFKDAGVERILVIVGFEADKIKREVARHPDLASGVEFVDAPHWNKGLAHSLAAASPHITEPVVLAMSDHVFANETIVQATEVLAKEESSLFINTHLDQVFDLDDAVKVRANGGRVEAMGRGVSGYTGVDAGLFVLQPEVFSALEQGLADTGELDISDAIDSYVATGKLAAVETNAPFDDVDTPSALVHCEMRLRRERREERVASAPVQRQQGSFTAFDYIIDKPLKTQIVVGRGFVKDPTRLDLIPAASASSPIFVFTDETVAEIYGYGFRDKLTEMGYTVNLIVLPVGEESKSLTNYAYLVERVLRKGVDEQSVFISLGGGVVCNVCGFIASTIYRGLNLIHLPTTLMAQSDAAVSHKQGINGYQGKNMVGTYYSPQMVAIDVETLITLPERLVADGISEVIKHAIGQDPAYVEFLLSHSGNLRDLDFIEETIRRNVALKCDLVASDPKELKEAMILQYGHTVGHPIEHLTGYAMYHGESVAVGMVVAAQVSRLMGGCDKTLVELQEELNARFQLPSRIPNSINPADILTAMRYNKRFLTEGTRMALLSGVGKLWSVNGDYVIPVSEKVLLEAVQLSKEG